MKNIFSCCRGDGGGNLHLALLSKTDLSGSMIFQPGDCVGQEDAEVHLHAPQTKTEHFWVNVWANCHLETLYRY